MEARTIGRYQLLDSLGAGAMGQVYRAHDPQLRRDVAIKVVRGDVGSVVDSQRFQREALTWAQVVHPSVVQLLDTGVAELKTGTHASYLVLELIKGETLEERVNDSGPLSEELAIKIMTSLAEGVAAAHAVGVLHRDLKPSNILLEGNRAKITDFGLAKLYQKSGQSLTGTGDVVGTPAYMSPEQVRGDRVGPATDVYALGAVLYFMLGGKPPHTIKVMAALFDQIVNHDPPPLAKLNPTITPQLNALVERCLAKDPARRYPTAKALAVALRNIGYVAPAGGGPASAGAQLSWGAGGMILGLLLGVAVTLGLTVSVGEVDLRRDSRYLRAEDRLCQDDWEGAEEDARALLREAPEDARLHCVLGDALLNQDEDLSAAVRSYEAALAIDPTHPRAFEGLIVAHINNKDYAQAKLACERALVHYPKWGSLHRRLARCRGELDGLAAELDGLQRALDLDPRDWNALRQRSTVRLESKVDDDAAERDAHAAVEIVGEDEANLYDNLVEIARRRKDYARALQLTLLAQAAAFRQAEIETLMIRRVGIALDMPNNEGLVLANQDVGFLLDVFPDNGSVHAQHAALLLRVGKLTDALAASERALKLYGDDDPKNAKVVRQNIDVIRAELERRRAPDNAGEQ